MMLNWQFKHYNDLSLNEFHDVIALRLKAFVVEQNCAYQDLDGKDKKSYHLICRKGDGELVGTMRIMPAGVGFEHVGIGRIVIIEKERGEHYGQQLVEEAMKFCRAEFGDVSIMLSSQKHLEKFYNKHGFTSTGNEYIEAGIPHVEMIYHPNK